jgi:hypothetical protein
VHRVNARALLAIACRSVTRCTAVGKYATEVTFVPTTGTQITKLKIDPPMNPTAISCPTTRRCVAVDQGGAELIFDPQRNGRVTNRNSIGHQAGLACPSLNLCVYIVANSWLVHDPVGENDYGDWSIGVVSGAWWLRAVACASASSCLAADGIGHTFTLELGSQPT